jgi:vacuolar-type H+-ATPase subunit B/Vma2
LKLIQVYSTEGQLEAEMIKGFLEAQGLNVTLSQESIGRTLGLSAGRLGQVKVLVPESQVTAAAGLLEAMERGDFEDEDFPDFLDET